MTVPRVALVHGDDLRATQALVQRQETLAAEIDGIERIVKFADDLNPAEFHIELQLQGLFSQARHFVIRHAEAVKRPKDLVAALCSQHAPGTYLTVVASSLPATSLWIKGLKGVAEITAVPAPHRKDLLALARRIFADHGLAGTPALIRDAVETSGGDLLALEQEATKLRTYLGQGEGLEARKLDRDAIQSLVFPVGETTIWPVLDRIGERDASRCLSALRGLREEPVRVMSMIMRHLTRLAVVRALQDEGMNSGDIGTFLGIPGWQLRKLSGQAKRWTAQELTAALDRAIRLDLEVKSGDRRPYDAMLKLVLS